MKRNVILFVLLFMLIGSFSVHAAGSVETYQGQDYNVGLLNTHIIISSYEEGIFPDIDEASFYKNGVYYWGGLCVFSGSKTVKKGDALQAGVEDRFIPVKYIGTSTVSVVKDETYYVLGTAKKKGNKIEVEFVKIEPYKDD